jgi:phosphoribosylglycinamide formyltransferase 1
MLALAAACQRGEVPADVALVISPSAEAPAVQAAGDAGLQVAIVEPGEEYGPRLVSALEERACTWVCLAGFLRLLPLEVLEAFPGRVLNIHPALLPKFGGKGMYGMRVHEAVLAAGELESGCTVHLVTEQYDKGAVILQLRCSVEPTDTPEDLAARVLKLEHQAYAKALRMMVERHGA